MNQLDPQGYTRPEADLAKVQPEYQGLPDATAALASARWLWLAAAMRQSGDGEQPLRAAAPARRPGSWAVLGAYVALVAASHVLWISFATVTGRAAEDFHTTELAIGLLVSVGPLCSAALSIPAGVVADRYGYRMPLLWAGLATSIFAFLRPLAGGLPMLLALTVGLLIPQPFLINAVADLVNRHFPGAEAATAAGLGTMAIFLGITLGLIATPPLASAAGVRGSQVVYAAASLAALVAFWRLAPRPVPERLVAPEELGMRQALARVLRAATQWKLSAALFLGFGCYLGITTWLEQLLGPRGIDEAGAGLVAGTITIAGMAGSVVLGAASDRIRRRKPFLVAAGVAAAPTLWLLGQLGSLGPLLAAAFVLGFFLLAALPIAIAVASGRLRAWTRGRQHRGRRDAAGGQPRRRGGGRRAGSVAAGDRRPAGRRRADRRPAAAVLGRQN